LEEFAMQAQPVPAANGSGFIRAIIAYFMTFKILKEVPKRYWGVQVVNFLDSVYYFGMINILSIFLSKDLGFDDKGAGYVITVFSSGITLALLVTGPITDWLGVRKTLIGSLIARAILTAAIGFLSFHEKFTGRAEIVAVLLILTAPLLAMKQTIFQTGIKNFTSTKTRSAGFSFWYLLMNLGAALGGALVDVVRKWGVPEGASDDVIFENANKWIMASGALTCILAVIAVFLMIRTDAPVEEEKREEKVTKQNPWQIFRSVFNQSPFWRLLALIGLTLGVRGCFVYMYLLMPKYWIRILGEGAMIGTLNTINPVLVVVLIILTVPLVGRLDTLKTLTWGSLVSGASLLALVIPWRWFGDDVVHSYYMMSIICMVVLSVGEVFWSPRLQEYTAAIAPKGQEGTYQGLAMLPFFVAKTVVSLLSGHMLMRWCPEYPKGTPTLGQRIASGVEIPFWDSPEAMWLILAIVAIAGSLSLFFLRPWFAKAMHPKEAAPTEA
jgi:MFS family permease